MFNPHISPRVVGEKGEKIIQLIQRIDGLRQPLIRYPCNKFK
ncbi:hypothetical protein M987_01521 [Enterobacter soli ATCC BAA-2102]|nr:hypothetical protein M987_01521 [Enterobacter soli ATCC BAA-2102]